MGYICCVPGCKFRKRQNPFQKRTSSAPTNLFKFPKNKALQRKWISSIPRKNFKVTPNSRVCKEHFKDTDFHKNSSDSNPIRRAQRGTQELARVRLKDTAVPSIFHDVTMPVRQQRYTVRRRQASARIEKDKVSLEESKPTSVQYDTIKDLASLKLKILGITLPEGYIISHTMHSVQFHYLESTEDLDLSPKLSASVIVKEDLQITVFIKSAMVPRNIYKHLLKSDRLQSAVELTNILSLCKSLSHQDLLSSEGADHLDMAASHLQNYLDCGPNVANDEAHVFLIKFIIEQLSLIKQPKHDRRYSADLVFQSFAWKLTSTSGYMELQDFFLLPNVAQLRHLSTAMTVESCRQALKYLKERGANLADSELTDALMDNVEVLD